MEETFIIRAYGRTELAQCYFPSLSPQAAYWKIHYVLTPRAKHR